MMNTSNEKSISQSYQNLPPKHKGYLWAVVAVAIWGQAIILLALIVTFASPDPQSTTISASYQALPSNQRAYLWILVFITLWSQVIIIVGGWLRKLVKRENARLKEVISALDPQIDEKNRS